MDHPQVSRIVIDSEAAWLRVKENLSQGMNGVMEARLSTLPGGSNGPAAKGLRREVEARLAKIRQEMFNLSHPNLRVNGYNYETFVQATEPWDEILDRNIRGLNVERVAADIEVAEKRRKFPEDIGRVEDILEERRMKSEWFPDGVEENERVKARKAEDIPKPPRHQETVDTFTTVVSNLSELAAVAPTQVSRAQRAQTVREEIASMPL